MTIRDVLKSNADKYREELKVSLFQFPKYFRLALPEIAKCQGQSPTMAEAESLVAEWFKLAIPYPNYPLSEGLKAQLAQELRDFSEARSCAKLKKYRLDCGLTQSELADELEFEDDKTVRRHEHGEGMYPDTRLKYKKFFETKLGHTVDF